MPKKKRTNSKSQNRNSTVDVLVSFNAIIASLILAKKRRQCINILLDIFSPLICRPGEYYQFIAPSEISSEEILEPLIKRVARRMRIKLKLSSYVPINFTGTCFLEKNSDFNELLDHLLLFYKYAI